MLVGTEPGCELARLQLIGARAVSRSMSVPAFDTRKQQPTFASWRWPAGTLERHVLSRRCANAAQITRAATRDISLFARALEAAIAFATRAIAGVVQFGGGGVSLYCEFSGHDAMTVMVQPIIASGGFSGCSRSRDDNKAEGGCPGKQE